jgi:proline dehydrogenase
MLDNAAKTFFHVLSRSGFLKDMASKYGMRAPTSFARRFIAGETIEEAVEAARAIERAGLTQTLDYLGESVSTMAEAEAATRDYLHIIDTIVAAGIGRNLSLKLTQLGLDVDRTAAVEHLRRILDHATGFFVRIDMENSPYTEVTLEIFETLWRQGYRHIGVVLQADLYRTDKDVDRMNDLGARIRLVKGAYTEPRSIAYPRKVDVDLAYVRLLKKLLVEGHYPAIATHDPAMIDRAKQFAREHAIAKDRFEFQMLYGIRRDLQNALIAEGYRVRVYIPFGQQWFPYFMRRLGERPANVAFVLRGIVQDRGTGTPG